MEIAKKFWIRREKKWSGSGFIAAGETRCINAGMRVVQERGADNLPLLEYTRGPDLSRSLEGAGSIAGLLAISRLDGVEPVAYHADGLGNVTALVNVQQAIVASYYYDPCGSLLAQSGPCAEINPYQFSFKEFIASGSLYYYAYRFYDPNLQRCPSRNPIGEGGGLNLYTFVENQPTSRIEPLGLLPPGAISRVHWTISIGPTRLDIMELYRVLRRYD